MNENVFLYLRSGNLRLSFENQKPMVGVNYNELFTDVSDESDRPGFSKLVERIQSSFDGTLYIYDLLSLDSCFESLESYLEFFALLERRRFKLIALTDKIPQHPNVSFLLDSFKRCSKELHREHLHASFSKRKLSGLSVGRPMQRNDDKIQELREEGLTFREIAQRLNVSISMVQRGLSSKFQDKT
ncbi:MAG: helix-turn-helix domain-containing protein [Bdellovibrionota bacterium]